MNAGFKTWFEGSGLAELGVGEGDIMEALRPRYEVLSLAGAGASACVFKVADLAAGREVKAVKLTPLVCRDQAADPAEAARAEFALASRFAHPNLARYFDLDIPPDRPFALTTMEFVDGLPFSAAVGRGDIATTCELMVQLLRGLAFLHDAGFVHGDVKPSNVLCGVSRGSSWAKLLDFHLALRGRGAAEGKARGTLRYMAPEVIAGGAPEARSDLYSAGVLFFEALTGRALFDGPPLEIAAQHLAAPIAHAEGDGELRGVLDRLLSKHPDGRYASASEAIAAVGAGMGGGWLAETRETLLGRVRSVPLIGRDNVLQEFSGLLESPGEPGALSKVFLIQGQPGLGKTRLLRECKARAQCAGLRALLLEQAQTTDALLDRIAQWAGVGGVSLSTHSETAVGDAAETGLPFLSVSVPSEGGGATTRLPPSLMRRSDRLVNRLVQLAGERRAALFLDDLDEMPPDAIECVLFLIRGTRRSLIVFGLAVSEVANAEYPLRSALEAWQQEGLVTEVVLGELTETDRRRLIREALPSATAPMAMDALAQRSGGSPAVIALTLEHLAVSGKLIADGKGSAAADFAGSLPDTLAQLSAEVLESVDEGTREALELLATAGEEVDADVLAAAAGVEIATLLQTIQKGPAAALASSRRTDRGVLCKLQHPCLTDALLEHAPRRYTQNLHDRLADAMENDRSPGAGAAATIARHRLQGRSPQRGVRLALELLGGEGGKRPEEAHLELVHIALSRTRGVDRTTLLEIAGDLNRARGAAAEAVGFLRRAARAPHLSASDRFRLLQKLGNAYAESREYAKARHTLNRALEMCGGVTEPESAELASILLLLARTDFHESKYRDALENYERVRRLGLALRDERLVATALHGLGATHLELRALGQSGRAMMGAVRKFRKVGDAVEAARALATLGYLAMLRQEWQESLDLLNEALPPLKAAGRLTEAARALSYLGAVHQKLCGWDQATEHYEGALGLYERLGHVGGQSAVLVNLSQLNASRGWLELAMAQAEQARRLVPTDPRMSCHAMNRLARAQYSLGDLAGARGTSAAAAELAVASDLLVPLESAYRTLGEIETLEGQWTAAREHLQSALAICQRTDSREREAICLARLAELAMGSGDLASALSLVESACSKAEPLEQNSVHAVTQLVKGKLLLAKNLPKAALPYLIQADEVFGKTRVWDDLVEVSSLLGKAYATLGQLRFAALCYRLALDTVEHVASHLRSLRNRALFLADPRRAGLFEAASKLRLHTGGSASA